MKKIILTIFFIFILYGIGLCDTYKIGLVTDLHHRTSTDSQITNLENIFNIYIFGENIDKVIFLGDMISTSTNRADNQTQIAELCEAFSADTYWVIGNHDLDGTTLSNLLTDRPTYCTTGYFNYGGSQNFYIDLGDWRIICIDTVSGENISTDATTLTFLEDELEDARIDNKYILIMSHAAVNTVWSCKTYNATDVYAKITTAVAAGAKVKGAFCGHGHQYKYQLIDNIKFYECSSAYNNLTANIIYLEDDGNIKFMGARKKRIKNGSMNTGIGIH